MSPQEKDILMDIRENVAAIKAHLEDQKERISKIEDNQTWLWRTVVGAILVGSLSILFHMKG